MAPSLDHPPKWGWHGGGGHRHPDPTTGTRMMSQQPGRPCGCPRAFGGTSVRVHVCGCARAKLTHLTLVPFFAPSDLGLGAESPLGRLQMERHAHVRVHIRMRATCTPACKYVRAHLSRHAHARAHRCAHTHVHSHTHTHTHAPSSPCTEASAPVPPPLRRAPRGRRSHGTDGSLATSPIPSGIHGHFTPPPLGKPS